MVKVFDYSNSKKGWVEFDSYDSAKKYVEDTLDTYYWIDRDNCYDYFMEIYTDGRYEVWVGEFGSWWPAFCDEDGYPERSIYYGSREEMGKSKYTDLNPRVDYILI